MRKVAFEISDNSIQASSSYAGPSVEDLPNYQINAVKIFNHISMGRERKSTPIRICTLFRHGEKKRKLQN